MAIVDNQREFDNGVLQRSVMYDWDAETVTVISGPGATPVVSPIPQEDIDDTKAFKARESLLEELPRTVDDVSIETAEHVVALFESALNIESVLKIVMPVLGPSLAAAGIDFDAALAADKAANREYMNKLAEGKAEERKKKLDERQGKA